MNSNPRPEAPPRSNRDQPNQPRPKPITRLMFGVVGSITALMLGLPAVLMSGFGEPGPDPTVVTLWLLVGAGVLLLGVVSAMRASQRWASAPSTARAP